VRTYALSPEDAAFVESYRPGDWPRPALTADVAIFTVLDADLKVLLIRRGQPPFRGRLALPGGFVQVGVQKNDQGEDLDDAAQRELHEETGLPPGSAELRQLGAYGEPGRDPRTRVVTVAYIALVPSNLAPLVRGGDDAAEAGWHSVAQVDFATLAFDHDRILHDATSKLRADLAQPSTAAALVAPTFTIPELRAVYEAVWQSDHDAANFRRKFRRWVEDGLVERAPGHRATARKPAAVYRFSSK
jgi:8-oxo-dGTP diphosphatase